ncbi:MAG: TrkA family potassium uptake protein [Candidatus Firestonebacteria bacterium]
MYIIIVGGGKIGYHLARSLLSKGHEILIVEKERSRFLELSSEFGENVVLGDGADSKILKEIGCNRADVLVAVTGEDEDNLVICQMAKILYMTPKIIARVNNPENEEILTILGVDVAISVTRIINNIITKTVDKSILLPLLPIKEGKVEIVQTEISSSSKIIGKPIMKINLPKDCIIICVIRGDNVIFPKGETILQEGDTIIAIVSREYEKELRDIL